METRVPLSFELERGVRPWEKFVSVSESENITIARFEMMDLEVLSEPLKFNSPSLESVSQRTPGFKQHGWFGYTLEPLTEVFIYSRPLGEMISAVVRLGPVEITLGQATPLAYYLFDGVHDEHTMPEWDQMNTLRVYPSTIQDAEEYVLNALVLLGEHLETSLHLLSFDDEDSSPSLRVLEETEETHTITRPCGIADVEPLRLIYRGQKAEDPSSAFLSYYRTLEYYSIVSQKTEVTSLRNDRNIQEDEFVKQIVRMVSGDERGLLCRLIEKLADAKVLEEAKRLKLITERPAPNLGNELYNFRNGLVHAKHDHGFEMHVPSVFSELEQASKWRQIAGYLALAALRRYGTKH